MTGTFPSQYEGALTTETTPLLRTDSEDLHASKVAEHEALYDRFSQARKKFILFLVSCSALVPFFASGTFFPAIPQIAEDFDTTPSVVSLAITISMATTAFGMLVWARYSTFYGRRPVFLAGLPMLALGSLGVAVSNSIPQLMVWRVVQAFGASGGMSVGAGTIGDIYKLEERGTAMGIFFGASLLGPAIAPLAGGAAAHYSSWRMMQLAICLAGSAMLLAMFLFFPETSHPGTRGVDKLLTNQTRFVFLNPFRPLELMKSPNLVAVMICGTFVLFTDYVLMVPLAYTMGVKYNITNAAFIGACFLPAGIGNIIGAPLAGRLSDITVVKWKKRRNGEWVPEDRIRACHFGAFFLVPFSVLAVGFTTAYVDGILGLVLNLIWLFWNGIGVDLVLSPISAYNIDILHHRSAEAMAASNSIRSALLALGVAAILPMLNTFGLIWTSILTASLAWIGAVILWATIQYGDRMRSWIAIEYTTSSENN